MFQGGGEGFRISLRAAGDGAVVDEGGGAGVAVADVDVGVWEFVFFEPFDDSDSERAGRGSFGRMVVAVT